MELLLAFTASVDISGDLWVLIVTQTHGAKKKEKKKELKWPTGVGF